MKKLNDMFSIDGERLIKTSNGQPVSEDEPVFILRARDACAIRTLLYYSELCEISPEDRRKSLAAVIRAFQNYANTHPTKIPGVTHGR